MFVPYKNLYNFILDRPYIKTLKVVAYLIHLKLKFHNFQGNSSQSIPTLMETRESIRNCSKIKRKRNKKLWKLM